MQAPTDGAKQEWFGYSRRRCGGGELQRSSDTALGDFQRNKDAAGHEPLPAHDLTEADGFGYAGFECWLPQDLRLVEAWDTGQSGEPEVGQIACRGPLPNAKSGRIVTRCTRDV
jgi:hypothetical protein